MSMTIHEFGQENKEVIVMIHPLGVHWDVFEYVIPDIAKKYHLVIPAIPGMDVDKPDTIFTSVEEIASDLENWLKQRNYASVKCLYGCSMGGAIVTRMIANSRITSHHIIIDGGMTPYQLPKILTYFIGARDWCMFELGKHCSTKILRDCFRKKSIAKRISFMLKSVLIV